MQSNPHEMLYKSLLNITARVKTALGENDTETLVRLAKEHRNVIDELKQTGLSQDPQLLDLVKETSDKVREVIVAIRQKRDETGKQLNTVGNRKKLARAYGKFKPV